MNSTSFKCLTILHIPGTLEKMVLWECSEGVFTFTLRCWNLIFSLLLSSNQSIMLYHGTIIRTGIKCKKIPLQKSIEFGMVLK